MWIQTQDEPTGEEKGLIGRTGRGHGALVWGQGAERAARVEGGARRPRRRGAAGGLAELLLSCGPTLHAPWTAARAPSSPSELAQDPAEGWGQTQLQCEYTDNRV